MKTEAPTTPQPAKRIEASLTAPEGLTKVAATSPAFATKPSPSCGLRGGC
ncbi:MAG: hypothetical protein HGA90_08115, partial [Alphaproteobacteria bacterium]|nr:hypothetical protein [Alphaproteobacteria bacterium]